MRRLPPPSATSLPATFFSFLIHAAAVVGGVLAVPHMAQPAPTASQMLYIPLELVTIDETTNMTAVVQAQPEPAKEEPEEAAVEAAPPPPPAPPPVDEDTVNLEKPQEKPKEQKKPEAAAAPAPKQDFQSELDAILSGVKAQPRQQRNTPNAAPAAGAAEAPRMSVGDRKRMTASIADYIKSQLVSKQCWADHSDMADAKRLRATFRVWFGRNGKFSQRYELVQPAREPFNDPPLQAFIAHARRALDKCNNLGWQVPEEYFQLPQPQYIDLEFLPKIGVAQ